MAVVRGPCFSFEARGQIAKALIFRRRLGSDVVSRYFVPRHPNSAAQQIVKARTAAAVTGWQALNAGNRATWNTYAAGFGRKGYNMYVSAFVEYMRDNAEAIPASPFLP